MNKVMNVLYAEDDKYQAEILMMSAKRYGKEGSMAFDVAKSVSEAIGKIDQGTYDAAILDWNLTDGFGKDIARHIRTSDDALPIVFFSGTWTSEQVDAAQPYAPAGCIEKGYSRSDFERISELIGASSAH